MAGVSPSESPGVSPRHQPSRHHGCGNPRQPQPDQHPNHLSTRHRRAKPRTATTSITTTDRIVQALVHDSDSHRTQMETRHGGTSTAFTRTADQEHQCSLQPIGMKTRAVYSVRMKSRHGGNDNNGNLKAAIADRGWCTLRTVTWGCVCHSPRVHAAV